MDGIEEHRAGVEDSESTPRIGKAGCATGWLRRNRCVRGALAGDESQIPLYIKHRQNTSLYRFHHAQRFSGVKKLTAFGLVALPFLSMSFLSKFIRSFSMSSAPATPMTVPAGAETATVAAGCFWGVEHMYRKAFANKGLLDARVGYIGGDTTSPNYRAVCSGRTGRTHCLSPICASPG